MKWVRCVNCGGRTKKGVMEAILSNICDFSDSGWVYHVCLKCGCATRTKERKYTGEQSLKRAVRAFEKEWGKNRLGEELGLHGKRRAA